MKKLFLIGLVISFSVHGSRGQVLTIDPATQSLQMSAQDYSSDAIAYIHNNSAVSRTIKWVRYVDVQPDQWTTTVCDDNLCYSPSTSSMTVTIAGNAQGLLKLNVFPANEAGSGQNHFAANDVNDSANANALESVNVTASNQTGISTVSDAVISIYPIPAKDMLYVNLDGGRHITSMEIYNVVGQKVKTVPIQDGLKSVSVSVTDLKKGVYFLRVVSGEKEITTRTFSKD
ncbi:MAG: T9SS type A sorting domain-containing protein [Chitinophagales bacterium]